MNYLSAGFFISWLIYFTYLLWLHRKLRRIEKRLNNKAG
ncbi:MAG: CcmD family protein [Sedimentisphaerales bacterium]|nr:CcmD family protein [Sedimentisphaerales bacterium]